jgi:two-component system cell cycle sensor histidine kinase/response regulator CckA
VIDNGSGIKKRDLTRIFEPFFTTKTAQGGIGLGLSQVYGILQQHGGTIEVDSTLGKGTIFQIYLPLTNQEILPVSETQSPNHLQGEGELVLIVEDDESLQYALMELYEEHDFQVILAPDGKKGLDIIEQIGETISLVITDLVMPRMSGREMFRRIRKFFPSMKFIFITGHPEQITGIDINQDPALRLMIKPFSMEDILSLTLELLSQENEPV